MTTWLADTSVWVRYINAADALHADCVAALAALHRRGDVVRTTPQVLIEFRSVATRPVTVNGLGLTPVAVSALAAGIVQQFPLLDDTPAVYPAWVAVVDALGVAGKQVHDARLVAVCAAHAVGRVLTLNGGHFARLAAAVPGFAAAAPADVLAGRA